VVSVIPDLDRLISGGLPGAQQAGGLGTVATIAGPLTGAVKTIALGGLALLALTMMVLMVRKASRAEELPTAEELVGVPPALQRGNDLVGEADEADSALAGIELSDDHIRSAKMREQVEDMVKANPDDAALLLNRWIQSDD
jgi:flagellar biosynthesis/type III secretory pathway M-ring protein FliF/YscJ